MADAASLIDSIAARAPYQPMSLLNFAAFRDPRYGNMNPSTIAGAQAGSWQNQGPRPSDPVAQPIAETLNDANPLWAAYQAPKLAGDVVNSVRDHDAAGAFGSAAMLAMSGFPGLKAPKGITAYHGSPHSFERFDLSKIGTGEGAQAYGHGLYFADSEAVAKSYRDALTPGGEVGFRVNGKPAEDLGLYGAAHTLLNDYKGDIDAAVAGISRRVADTRARMAKDPALSHNVQNLEGILGGLEKLRGQKVETAPNGHMYQVRIHADPEHLLDWDKPISQQSEAVRRAVEKLPQADMFDFKGDGGNSRVVPVGDRRGESFHNALAEALGRPYDRTKPHLNEWLDKPKATEALRDAGIPGIKYFDGGSRTAGEGSRNYVVFDDKLVEILKKYGLIGMLGGGAAMQGATEGPK